MNDLIGHAKRVVCCVRPDINTEGKIVIPDDLNAYYLGNTTVNQQVRILKEESETEEAVTIVWYEPQSVKLAPLINNELSEKHYKASILDVDLSSDKNFELAPLFPMLILPLQHNTTGLLRKPPAIMPKKQRVDDAVKDLESLNNPRHTEGVKRKEKRMKKRSAETFDFDSDTFGAEDNNGIENSLLKSTKGQDKDAFREPRVYGFQHFLSNLNGSDAQVISTPDEASGTTIVFDYESYFCIDGIDYSQYQPSSVVQSFLRRHDEFNSPRADCVVTNGPRGKAAIVHNADGGCTISGFGSGTITPRDTMAWHLSPSPNAAYFTAAEIMASVSDTEDDKNDEADGKAEEASPQHSSSSNKSALHPINH